jgi:hypothetical protein
MIRRSTINMPYLKGFLLDFRATVFVEATLINLSNKPVTLFFKGDIKDSNYKITTGILNFDADSYIFLIENELIDTQLVLYIVDSENNNVFSIFKDKYTSPTNVHAYTFADIKISRLLRSIRNQI